MRKKLLKKEELTSIDWGDSELRVDFGKLYNLATDPAEQHNVVKEHPEIAKAMFAKILQAAKAGRTRP